MNDELHDLLAASRREERLSRRRTRSPEPPIVDPANHPRREVCLHVAALFLGLDARTVKTRIEDGRIKAWRDGKVYRIPLESLIRFDDIRKRSVTI